MKHLFLVHSPITFLSAISVIAELKIAKEDAVIIFFEFEVIRDDKQYQSISVNEFYGHKGSFKKLYNYFRYFNIINRFDKIVDAAIGNEKFIVYVPVLLFSGKALITHRNCYSFNFIEEGLAHHYKEETFVGVTAMNSKDSWRSSLLKNTKKVLHEMYIVARGYNFKLQALPFSYTGYTAFPNVLFYGFTQESFPLAPGAKKKILAFVKKGIDSITRKLNLNLNDKIIWIGDGGVAQHGFDENIYLQGIQDGCIEFIKNKTAKNIFIKFHRDEPEYLRNRVKKIFNNNGISFEVIPDSTVVELVLFESANVTLIGVFSSLLFYASIMGHHSFSIYEFVKNEYSSVLKNRDFSFYWDKVQRIEKPVITFAGVEASR